MADNVQRKWMPYAKAAQLYMGISSDYLLGAIKRHELRAYEKPILGGIKSGAKERKYHSYFVNLDDVDAYVRTHWDPAFPEPPC